MKRNMSIIFLIFLILIATLLLITADQVHKDEATRTPIPWLPPKLTPDPLKPTLKSGWWDELPTPIPFSSPTPRK